MATKDTAVMRPGEPGPIAEPKKLGMFRALRHRDFRYLISGTFLTHLGIWVQSLGQGWLVYELTKSPLQLTLVGFFGGAGNFLCAPIGGSLADRIDRRHLLLATQFLSMIIALMIAVLVSTDSIRVWHLYATGFASGAVGSVLHPTRSALIYDVIPKGDLPNAIGLNSIITNGNRLLGPSLGGVLLAVVGVEGTFFFQAGALVLAMFMALHIQGVFKSAKSKASFFSSIISGLKYARKDRDIALLLWLSLTYALLAWPYNSLLPAYSSDVLGLGGTGFAMATASMGMGAVMGSLVIATREIGPKGKVLLGSQVVGGLFLMIMGFSSIIPLSFVALAMMGLTGAFQMGMNQILLQTKVADEYRGRVLALHHLTFGLQPLSLLPAGVIGERWGVEVAIFVLGAMLFVLVGVMAVASKRARAW